MRVATAVLLAVLLTACAAISRHEAASIHEPVVYSCEDGLTLRVRFTHEAAHVTLPSGQEMLLPQQPSGSGIRYGSADTQLQGKGEDATFSVKQHRPVACRVQH